MFERKQIVVADDEIVLHIERRERFAERRIQRIDGFAEIRRLILRLAEGVAAENREAAAGVAQRDLERVVIRIADGGLARVAAEIRTERAARAVENLAGVSDVLAVFAKRTARNLAWREVRGIAERKAKRRIARVGLGDDEEAMSLRADVIHAQNRVRAEAALERQHIFLGVGNAIRREVVRKAGDRLKLRPVDGVVGMARAGIQWSECDGESLSEILAGRGGDERSGKERRRWTCVGGSVGSVGAHDADGEGFDCGVEHAVAGANAGLARTAEKFGEEAVARRVW